MGIFSRLKELFNKNIECDGLNISCRECKNKEICDIVSDIIKIIGVLYEEKK